MMIIILTMMMTEDDEFGSKEGCAGDPVDKQKPFQACRRVGMEGVIYDPQRP